MLFCKVHISDLGEVMSGSAYANRTVVLLPRSTALAPTSLLEFTPLPREHFYYVRVTQDDSKMLGARLSGSRNWPADTLSIVRSGNFNYSNIFLARKAGSIVTKSIK